MATFSATVTPGKIMQYGEKIDNAKLNQGFRPTVSLVDQEDDFWAWLMTSEILTGASAVDITKRITILNATSGGPYAITIASGTYIGQLKLIDCRNELTSAQFDLTGTFASGITSYSFGTIGGSLATSLTLFWDGVRWQNHGGNAAAVI